MLSLAPPHDARPHANVRRKLALDPAGDLPYEWKVELGIQRFEPDTATSAGQRPLLARFPDAAAIVIRPRVPFPPQRLRLGLALKPVSTPGLGWY